MKLVGNQLFLISVLEKIEKNYTFTEFIEFQTIEKSKLISDFTNQVFKESDINSKLFNQIRFELRFKNFNQNNVDNRNFFCSLLFL